MLTRRIPAFPLCDGSKTYEMQIARPGASKSSRVLFDLILQNRSGSDAIFARGLNESLSVRLAFGLPARPRRDILGRTALCGRPRCRFRHLVQHSFLLTLHLCRPEATSSNGPGVCGTQPEAHPGVLCHSGPAYRLMVHVTRPYQSRSVDLAIRARKAAGLLGLKAPLSSRVGSPLPVL